MVNYILYTFILCFSMSSEQMSPCLVFLCVAVMDVSMQYSLSLFIVLERSYYHDIVS